MLEIQKGSPPERRKPPGAAVRAAPEGSAICLAGQSEFTANLSAGQRAFVAQCGAMALQIRAMAAARTDRSSAPLLMLATELERRAGMARRQGGGLD